MTEGNFDYLMKFVLIGDSSVGKSNLLLRFAGKPFSLESKPTIGVEFFSKNISIKGKTVKAQIWDTAGQERFRAITQTYYRGAVGAIIAFDITRSSTFQNVDKWLAELKQNSPKQAISIMLVGNKIDLEQKRMVKTSEGKEYADRNGLFYMQTSALDEEGVNRAFQVFIQQTYQLLQKNNSLQKKKAKPVPNEPRKQKLNKDSKKIDLAQKLETLKKDRCCV